MTAAELLEKGFKQKKIDGYIWYELSIKKHKFLTNDKPISSTKDVWFIGYQYNGDDFWFNGRLKKAVDFDHIFRLLTGINSRKSKQV